MKKGYCGEESCNSMAGPCSPLMEGSRLKHLLQKSCKLQAFVEVCFATRVKNARIVHISHQVF